MNYTLVDKNPSMVSAWKELFNGEENVNILNTDITEVPSDAIVSPANSFGFMDGGVDYAISMRLGWELQFELQKQIKALPEGELLVGKALILETGDELIPHLISAPTMRVPMNFNINTSVNAYLAMKAVMISAKNHPEINWITIPGFCTGVGKMQSQIAAKQMYQAFIEIEKGEKMNFNNFGESQKYHWNINPQGMIFE